MELKMSEIESREKNIKMMNDTIIKVLNDFGT
jgi:hypothetical protein